MQLQCGTKSTLLEPGYSGCFCDFWACFPISSARSRDLMDILRYVIRVLGCLNGVLGFLIGALEYPMGVPGYLMRVLRCAMGLLKYLIAWGLRRYLRTPITHPRTFIEYPGCLVMISWRIRVDVPPVTIHVLTVIFFRPRCECKRLATRHPAFCGNLCLWHYRMVVWCRVGSWYVEGCWGFPYLKKLLVISCSFLRFWFLGFLVSKCLGFLVSKFLGFKCSCFQSFKALPNFDFMFS